jgi:Ca2+-binding RTX toxin-like protein
VLYNQNVQEIAEQKGNSLEDNVRLFAMFNVAMADTGIATWKAKFDYDLWRPITAIREGDMDGNPLTIADPNWIPLGAPGPNPNSSADDFTPPFPAYTSGHAGFGAAVFRTLARFYGSDQFSFTLTSEELPGVTRSYSSFSQAAEENGRSRIYLGIHWEFDNSQGQILGNRVADYVATGMFIRRSDSTMIEIQRHGAGFRAGVLPSGTPIDIVVEGNSLKIINHRTGALIYHEPVNQVASIRIDQRNQATDFARIIVATGTVMPQSLVLEIVGNENWFDGMGLTTGDGNDHVVLNGDTLQAYGVTPPIHLYGIGYVDIGTHGGNDILAVHGDQRGRQVDLGGYGGNDWYEIWSTNAKLYVSDTAGYDSFSFENLNAGIYFDMELNAGQLQPLAGNSLFMWGWFEAVIGTMFADVLMGTQYDNFLDGRKGDDTIHGRAGNDTLYGGQGNDLLYGNLGDDVIYGHKGNDILLGGFGNDYLYGGDDADLLIGSQGVDWLFGEAGDDILIGGTTTHDFDAVALRAILAEWTSSRSRTIRQLNIQSGTGSTTRLNGKYYLKTGTGGTVIDDKEADTLVKGANDAWVFSFTRDTTRT